MGTTLRHQHNFRPTHWRRGYCPEQVDAFVSRVETALRSATPQLSAYDVFCQPFVLVRGRPGYHVGDVDHYLEDAEHHLERHEHFIATSGHQAHLPAQPLGVVCDVAVSSSLPADLPWHLQPGDRFCLLLADSSARPVVPLMTRVCCIASGCLGDGRRRVTTVLVE
jgi:DivIVA domain-containing protein